MTEDNYSKYLCTIEWKQKSTRCKEMADYKCEKCNSTESLHAHHLTYINVGNEKEEDLQCLCEKCHLDVHNVDSFTFAPEPKKGWRRMYLAYDEVMIGLKSQKEIQMFIMVRNMFTKNKPNIGINKTRTAKKVGVNRVTFSRFIKKLLDSEFIQEQEDGTYKMNPYMFIPYQADAKSLQQDWEVKEETK